MALLAIVGIIAYWLSVNSNTLSTQSKTYRSDKRAEMRLFVSEQLDCYNTVILNNLRTCQNRPIDLMARDGSELMNRAGTNFPVYHARARAVCGATGTIDIELYAENSQTWSKAFGVSCPK